MSFQRSLLVAAVLLGTPLVLSAQHVTADIAIGSGPVSGRILIGDPYPHHDVVVHRHPAHRPVYREVIIIRGHRGHGWYRRHGYRTVRVWYDATHHAYYSVHPGRNYSGLREIEVYERDGRYVHEVREEYGRRRPGGRH
jgi:hypothetical protein